MSTSVMCLQCGETLVSVHRHDFAQCKCSNETFVDGGDEYFRVGGVDVSKIEVIGRKTMKKRTKAKKIKSRVVVNKDAGETFTLSNNAPEKPLIWTYAPPKNYWDRFVAYLRGL